MLLLVMLVHNSDSDTDRNDMFLYMSYLPLCAYREELQKEGRWHEVVAMTDELLQLMGFLGEMPPSATRPTRATATFHFWPGSAGDDGHTSCLFAAVSSGYTYWPLSTYQGCTQYCCPGANCFIIC
jgi:hypothetical protein